MKNTYLYYLLAIIILTIVVFSPTFENGFTNWDDQIQVINNSDIKELSFSNIQNIFSSFYVGMYQPITTLFFSIEYAFFGLNPMGFHTVSLLFHIVNILLVFWLICLLTKRKDMALIVCSFFAIHPMFVEVISWVSARSTLIYTSFYLGSIISYLYYLKNGLKRFLGITFLLFILSILSKVMAVTLPLLLILFDFYFKRKLLRKKVILEKVPFFIISLLFIIIAFYGRQVQGHINNDFTFWDKPFTISFQILWYVCKVVLPVNLSAFYPIVEKSNGFLPYYYYILPFLLILFSFITYKLKEYRKIIIFTFLFFLINISLVLNFIQVGEQQTTDRYTYIAYIGFFLLISFVYKFIVEKKPQFKSTLTILLFSFILVFSYLSYQRTKVWKSSRTLWSDVIDKNDKISLAYTNIGVTYVNEDNLKAEKYFLKAIEVDSNFVIPYNNLGYIYLKKQPKKAVKYLFKAMEVDSTYLYIYTNLAELYMNSDKLKAKKYILKAESINPTNFYVQKRKDTWNSLWGK